MVLGRPGPPASLAYHPLERLTDPVGWAGERIIFLGRDGRWRELNLGDLGLPEAWWPGADTFGAGSLSDDGRMWVAHTNAGVVFVNLTTGTHRHVAFPRTSPVVRAVTFIPGRDVVSAYARLPEGLRYSTFHVWPGGRLTRVSYDGRRTRFDVDGTPVEVSSKGRTLILTRSVPGGHTITRWRAPRGVVGTPYGVFGEDQVAIQPTLSDDRSMIVWVFEKHSGQIQARLRIPPGTTIERWTDRGRLTLYLNSRRLVTWDPQSGRVRRLLEVPGPYPGRLESAASTVSLARS